MTRDFLYWELHEGKFIQGVRVGDWKAAKHGPNAKVELYDLGKDVAEASDIAAEHPDVVQKLTAIMQREHVPSPLWSDGPVAGAGKGKKKANNKKAAP